MKTQRIAHSVLGQCLSLLVGLSLTMPSSPVRAQTSATAPATSKLVLRIDEMSTPTCPVLVKAAVRRLDGIQVVEASLESRTATVTFDAGKTNLHAIQKIIKDQVGFDSTLAH